mgnify:CR=1 FL=1
MKKSELFALVLSIVSDVTEIPVESILSKSHKEDVVEARMLTLHFCRKSGLTPSSISELSGINYRCVNKFISKSNMLISNASGYPNNQLRFYCQTIESKLGLNAD